MRRLIVLAAVGAAALMVTPAFALTTGECLPSTQARQAVADEGMSPIVVGNRSGYGNPTALIYFSNADGSKGYAFLGDKPFGEQATTICVQSVYRDIHLNDITKPGVPSWARMPIDRARATAICARGGLGWQDKCLPHDDSLTNLESNGAHVMLVATGTAINPRDKSVRANERLVVAIKPADGKGIRAAVTPEGASYMLSAYLDVKYTQFGQAMFGR